MKKYNDNNATLNSSKERSNKGNSFNIVAMPIERSSNQPSVNGPTKSLMSHVRGCILGAFIGDAAGAVLEFHNKILTKKDVMVALKFQGGGCWKIQPGQITDDSEMAIWLMHAIIEANGVDQRIIAKKYLEWYKSPPFDIGITTQNAMRQIQKMEKNGTSMNECLKMIKMKNEKSLSNGCLMRATPLAVYCHNMNDDEIYKYTKLDVNLTHSNELAVLLVTWYNIAIADLINSLGNANKAIYRVNNYIDKADNTDLQGHWDNILNAQEESDLLSVTQNIGFIVIAFSYAFFYLIKGYSYTDAIKAILIKGGDTDTNAAIVGGLIGAQAGLQGINKNWMKAVLDCKNDRPDFLHPASVDSFYDLIDN